MTKKFSHSVKKHISLQKSLIRRQTGNATKQAELIAELYQKLSAKPAAAVSEKPAKAEKAKAKAKKA